MTKLTRKKSAAETKLRQEGALYGLSHVQQIAAEKGIEFDMGDGTSKIIDKIVKAGKA